MTLSSRNFSSLRSTSKILWYKKYVFLNLKKHRVVILLRSFQKLLQATLGFSKFTFLKTKLVLGQILFHQRAHLYFNTQEKYTVIKPKFNIFFPNGFRILQNNTILLLHQYASAVFLRIQDVKELTNQFRFLVLTGMYSNPVSKTWSKELYFRKVKFLLTKRFFLIRLFPVFLSKFQKRINFFQFKSFFKKLS